MALKRLTHAEMISLSQPWVRKDTPERSLIESIPETAAILPHIELAHGAILAAQPGVDPARLGALQEEQAQVDLVHDDLVRGIIGALTGYVYLTQDPARRAALVQLRDSLFPMGSSLVIKSYREEGGQGALLRARLGPEMRAMLKSLRGPEGTLLHAVEEYLRKARRLLELEDMKAAPVEGGPTPYDMVTARNQWIRAAHALVANLELAEADEATRVRLLAPLRAAERAADLRSGGSSAEDEDVATPPNGTAAPQADASAPALPPA